MDTEHNNDQFIENRTFDEIQVGDSSQLSRTLRPEDIKMFAVMSGDVNPSVVDPEFAHSGIFREVVAHGMWSGALISTVLGTQFPGPGTIYIDQSLHFSRPVTLGDTITITVTAKQKFEHNKHILFDCVCTNQEGLQVVGGTAEVLAPTEKIRRPRVHMSQVAEQLSLSAIPDAPEVTPLPDQEISTEVLLEKYAKGKELDVHDVRRRVARALAGIEPEKDRSKWEEKFLWAQENGFIPAGRINSAAGTDLAATLINCFVQPVGDSIVEVVDGRPGIYTALAQAAETMSNSGLINRQKSG